MLEEKDVPLMTRLVVTIPPRVEPKKLHTKWQKLAVVIYPREERGEY